MRRRQNALPRPIVRPQPAFEFELEGAVVVVTHLTTHGDRFVTRVERDLERVPFVCALSSGLHLAIEDAAELADEVRRRLGVVTKVAPAETRSVSEA